MRGEERYFAVGGTSKKINLVCPFEGTYPFSFIILKFASLYEYDKSLNLSCLVWKNDFLSFQLDFFYKIYIYIDYRL